jgi:hypothetical protein
MLSRSLAIIVSSWLPCFALILPLGRFHTINALVAGTVATVLSALALSNDRARSAAAIVGAWVAFTPFIVQSSFLEIVIATCWGVPLFVHMIGPFSQAPTVSFVRALPPPKKKEQLVERVLPVAA